MQLGSIRIMVNVVFVIINQHCINLVLKTINRFHNYREGPKPLLD